MMKKILDFFNRIMGLMIFLIFLIVLIEHLHGRHHWRHHGKTPSGGNYKIDSSRSK